MKIIIATVFVLLTRVDGLPVYVVPDNITEVTTPYAGSCSTKAKAFVRTFSSTYCVLETPEDVVKKFRDIAPEHPQT